jgi:AcrR family transcriptional regulator
MVQTASSPPPTLARPTPRAVSTARVREALIDAALTRFARDGFDGATADQVAVAAGVSPRTFFRYFPTKESVVFHRDYGFMRSFSDAFLAQPGSTSDYAALRATFVGLAAGFDGLRTRIETYRAAVDSSAVLVGHEQEHLRDHAATVADAVARRRGLAEADDECRLLGDVALAIYQRALRRWLDGPRSGALDALVDEEFTRLRALVR